MAAERKIATMLFADLVGSTEMASSSDPEHTRLLLDRFYDAMAEEIEATGGTIEKFAGDAVLAVYGVPAAHEDHAERALHTAIAMRARLRDLFGDALQLRIGVNTGEVVVGKPRRGSSFVSGDPVNVAARLEQGAAPGQILVGERTAAAAGGAFEFSDPETVAAKGKRDGVVARRLLTALAVARPRGRLGGTFVGRAGELEELEATYRSVVERSAPELVLVVGDAGVGKSALLSQLVARLSNVATPPRVRTARCPSYGRGLTYRPLADVLRQELGLHESDPPERALERLGNRPLLGLALGLRVAEGLHPVVVRERFHAAWTALLEEWTAEQPLVLVIEDLHWAENPLLELLRDVRRRGTGPLLLVGTARPEAAEAVSADVRIDLAPLSPQDASEVVTRLLGGELPAAVSELVVARAEGNPFFLEELLATLVDRGTIRRRDGTWAIEGSLAELDLPDTVHAVLASRIDLLPESEKRALQTASVIGRVFWEEPVRELMGDVDIDLGVLVDREFVLAQTQSSLAGETEYLFRHQLTREVAYASLPKAERGRLHAAVANRLERGRDEKLAGLLAHHYEQAVKEDYAALAWSEDPEELARLTERALHWLRMAAERATSRYEAEAAVAMLERALELARDDATRFELWRALADVQSLRYHTRGFVSATEHAIDLAPDDETITALFAELALRSSTAWLAWNPPLDRGVVGTWIDEALARAAPASRERAMALVAQAWHAYRAEETASEALALAERVGDPELIGWALRVHVIACMQSGRYDAAAEGAARILTLLDQVADPGNRETLIENTALRVAAATGRFDEARRFSELVSDIVQDLTPHNRLHAAAYSVEIEELTANWDRIRELEARVERAVQDNLDTPCVRNARSLLVCALAETAQGDHARAQRFVELASSAGMEGHDRELTAPRLRMALLRGDVTEARRLVDEYERPTLRFMFDMAGATAWFDAAAALGLRDAVESAAPDFAQPGTCFEPFALRALAIVRNDAELAGRADASFAMLGLRWHAEHAPQRLS
ncbi:MAG TPA: adenylate/guanylate cyclase domain-containing protein [Gaiellaceae bacterium]|nr:adenylate/guanylate cyclase domain-containing protein [Gaiellaceae bacterium]